MLQRRKLETRSTFRSVRYRINKNETPRTATANFRIKRNSCIDSTLYNTIATNNYENSKVELQNLIKTDYLRSFNSMMEKRPSLPEDSKLFQNPRVTIPNFQEYQREVEESEHPLLAPFHKPFTHVSLIFQKANAELNSQKKTCQQIKADLKHIKQSKIKQLNEIMRFGEQKFANIRSILRKNQISQQEKKLKSKRELEELDQKHEGTKQLFNRITEHSSSLQLDIFNSTPFDLEQAEEFGKIYI